MLQAAPVRPARAPVRFMIGRECITVRRRRFLGVYVVVFRAVLCVAPLPVLATCFWSCFLEQLA